MQQEHTDVVAEERSRDCKKMRRGFLQYHGGRRGGVHRGCGDIHVFGEATILVEQRLAGSPPEY